MNHSNETAKKCLKKSICILQNSYPVAKRRNKITNLYWALCLTKVKLLQTAGARRPVHWGGGILLCQGRCQVSALNKANLR